MTTLPPELVLGCLCQLEASDPSTLPTLLSVSLASRTFNDLSHSTILWRPLLELEYYRRGKAVPTDSEPKTVYETFRARALADQRAKALVRELQKPLNRLPVMEELRTSLASDVVQVLDGSEWRSPAKKPETHLSLQYWSEEARKTILRDEAVKTWQGIVERDLKNEEDEADFERGVNAFGAFRGFDPELVSSTSRTAVTLFLLAHTTDRAPSLRSLASSDSPRLDLNFSFATYRTLALDRYNCVRIHAVYQPQA